MIKLLAIALSFTFVTIAHAEKTETQTLIEWLQTSKDSPTNEEAIEVAKALDAFNPDSNNNDNRNQAAPLQAKIPDRIEKLDSNKDEAAVEMQLLQSRLNEMKINESKKSTLNIQERSNIVLSSAVLAGVVGFILVLTFFKSSSRSRMLPRSRATNQSSRQEEYTPKIIHTVHLDKSHSIYVVNYRGQETWFGTSKEGIKILQVTDQARESSELKEESWIPAAKKTTSNPLQQETAGRALANKTYENVATNRKSVEVNEDVSTLELSRRIQETLASLRPLYMSSNNEPGSVIER